ncbi:MAG: hypothetical protein LBT59_13320 [Clostridiales bacterium]|nr:hypothetical protein [Clostridiales bacterium]
MISAIERSYQAFISRAPCPLAPQNVDYFGFNFSIESPELAPSFKAYYNGDCVGIHSSLVDELDSLGLLLAKFVVIDQSNSGECRFELALKNRDNDHMEQLVRLLTLRSAMTAGQRSEALMLARMKLCDDPFYTLSSLYFFGFTEKNRQISVLKFHYLMRKCPDPERINRNITFDDEYFLSFLSNSGISSFSALVPVISSILDESDGHLWMAGADYHINGHCKYKIYIKNSDATILFLMSDALRTTRNIDCADHINLVASWISNRQELVFAGLALCFDDNNMLSCNLYFKLR